MGVMAERFAAQLLSGDPAPDPTAVAERLLAIQAQDARGARLAVRARSAGTTAADVDRALTEERSLVVAWLNRGTLHLVRREDHPWLLALTAPTLAATSARRLAQEGVGPEDAERAVAAVARGLADDGPLTRAQVRERVAAAGVRTEGQALAHVLLLAGRRGILVRGPMAGAEQAYVLVRDWLGEPPPVDRDAALRELARRYLAGHGPADAGDLARWAGLGLRDARAGLAGIASALHERPDGLLELAGRPPSGALPPPRLLGAFDPVLLGWRSREAVLGGRRGIVTVNGVFRPFALVEGRAAATWSMPRGEVVLEPFEPLGAGVETALRAEAAAVRAFLGQPGGRSG
jgi:hypothetical protein